MVHATDQNGLLVITQVQPIAVLFTLPEDNLPPVVDEAARRRAPAGGGVRSCRPDARSPTGIAADHRQPDRSEHRHDSPQGAVSRTRTTRCSPTSSSTCGCCSTCSSEAIIVPAAAIQRGPQGTFVYVVKADHTVEVRPVTRRARRRDATRRSTRAWRRASRWSSTASTSCGRAARCRRGRGGRQRRARTAPVERER